MIPLFIEWQECDATFMFLRVSHRYDRLLLNIIIQFRNNVIDSSLSQCRGRYINLVFICPLFTWNVKENITNKENDAIHTFRMMICTRGIAIVFNLVYTFYELRPKSSKMFCLAVSWKKKWTSIVLHIKINQKFHLTLGLYMQIRGGTHFPVDLKKSQLQYS